MASSSSFTIYLLLITALLSADAAIITVTNNCSYTVWAASLPGGSGRQLNQGQTWILIISEGTTGRIWARTGCNFNNSGHGNCETGDCNGLLQCKDNGAPPNTLAEFSLNQFNNTDFFDISLVDGFNVPMEFSPTSNGCTAKSSCTGDIIGQCPSELQTPGGCNNPCTVFQTNQYCCNSGSCEPTSFSRFFKNRCPDAYSYPKDDATSTFTCPGGTNYRVVFCPNPAALTKSSSTNSTVCQQSSPTIHVAAAATFKSCSNQQFYVSLANQ